MPPCWEIHGEIDSTLFFNILPKHFPEGTTLYIETTGIEPAISDLYILHQESGPYLAETQTIWPRPTQFRCRFSEELCSQLGNLSLNHAEPELLEHIALYSESCPLLIWPDAFTDPMKLFPSITEPRVAEFAKELGVTYTFNPGA